MSSEPSFAITTTAKIGGSGDISWAVTVTGNNGRVAYCGWDVIPIPMTGIVHVDFSTEDAPMDIYVYTYLKDLTLIANDVVINAVFDWCGSHPSSFGDCSGGIATDFSTGACVFDKAQVRHDSFDVNLPPRVASETYYMIVVQWGSAPVNLSTATIILNGSPAVTISSPTVTAVSLTPFSSQSLHFYTASPSAQPTVETSLQMPQPPQQSVTQPTVPQSTNNTPQLALALAVVAALALAAVFLYSRRNGHLKSESRTG